MFARPYWLNRLQETWHAVPIAWLAGVRRSGKTTIAQSLGADQTLYVNRDQVDAIECRWDPSEFDPAGLKAFLTLYPKGNNYLVCPSSVPPLSQTSWQSRSQSLRSSRHRNLTKPHAHSALRTASASLAL